MQKFRATSHSYPNDTKRLQHRCKQPTSKSFHTCLDCMHLFKLYDTSLIILLTNNLKRNK